MELLFTYVKGLFGAVVFRTKTLSPNSFKLVELNRTLDKLLTLNTVFFICKMRIILPGIVSRAKEIGVAKIRRQRLLSPCPLSILSAEIFQIEGRKEKKSEYGRILLYFALLCFADTAFFLNAIEGLWQLCVEQVCWHHFSRRFAYLVSLCHILVILEIFQTFSLLYLLWWSTTSDHWCYYGKTITTHWGLRWWLAFFFFRNKVFFNEGTYIFFRHNALIDYSIVWL